MPYNTNAIPRPEEITGTSALPLARVKKIIAQDEDIAQCSNSAAFAISIATEEFLRYLTEQAFNMAKSEGKPRKNIQYKDIASAVAKLDNLQFLSDTVPRTVTYGKVKQHDKERRARESADDDMNGDDEAGEPSNQRSIAQMMKRPNQAQTDESATNGAPGSPKAQRISLSMATSPIVDRTIQPTRELAPAYHPRNEDVEMGG